MACSWNNRQVLFSWRASVLVGWTIRVNTSQDWCFGALKGTRYIQQEMGHCGWWQFHRQWHCRAYLCCVGGFKVRCFVPLCLHHSELYLCQVSRNWQWSKSLLQVKKREFTVSHMCPLTVMFNLLVSANLRCMCKALCEPLASSYLKVRRSYKTDSITTQNNRNSSLKKWCLCEPPLFTALSVNY